MNLLSGNIKARDKKYPVLWTGQNAQHLAERHVDEHTLHPFLHVEVQQMAQKVGVLHPQFFELKTCYKK